MNNAAATYTVTDMTDAEVEALLSGTFSAADVETDAGAHVFAARARSLGCYTVVKSLLCAAPSVKAKGRKVNAAVNAARAMKAGPDYEGRILKAQETDGWSYAV